MDQVNGTSSPKKKQVFFSIGSYSEDKRVINKISTNGLFASATTDDAATMRPQPTRTLPKPRPVSLNFLDSTSKYQTLPARHRYNDGLIVEKPVCPPSSACNSPAVENGPIAGKPVFPPKFVDRSLSLEPEQLRHSGRVALTIAAYEGETRTPTRLDFLPSGRVSRASSKASSSTSSTPGEDVDGSRMMLQNELVATLKRSNLKKLTEDYAFQENETTDSPQGESKPVEEPTTNKSTLENIEALENIEKSEVLDTSKIEEDPKSTEPTETSENVQKTEEAKNNDVIEEVQEVASIEIPENKSEIKEEIDAVLTELENSTEEAEIIPVPPPMPEVENTAVKEESKLSKEETKLSKEENSESNGAPEIVELSNSNPVETSKDEVNVTPNGSVKQLAIELGKKMTFKADIERVPPEQNGISND